jgi:hypothetical protein
LENSPLAHTPQLHVLDIAGILVSSGGCFSKINTMVPFRPSLHVTTAQALLTYAWKARPSAGRRQDHGIQQVRALLLPGRADEILQILRIPWR